MRFIGYISLAALVVVLFAPALKLVYELGDVAVYYAPAALFGGGCVVLTVLTPNGLSQRILSATLLLVLFAASAFSFIVGGAGESALLMTILLNCAFAALVVLFPWDRRYVDRFALFAVMVGLAIALFTIDVYRSTGDFSGADERVSTGYLNTSFALGASALCAFYLVVRSMNPLTLGALAVCWLGLALGQGRGPVLFCATATLLYGLLVLRTRISSFGRGRKILLVGLIAGFVPIAIGTLLSVERNAARFGRLFSGAELEQDNGRVIIWRESLARIGESPLFGHGLGSYYSDEVTPHNLFLQYGEDSGLVGLVFLCLFLLLVLRLLFLTASMAPAGSINAVYFVAALFLYMLLNFQKSYDAYIVREIYILSALPIGLFAHFLATRGHRRRKRRRRRSSELLTQ